MHVIVVFYIWTHARPCMHIDIVLRLLRVLPGPPARRWPRSLSVCQNSNPVHCRAAAVRPAATRGSDAYGRWRPVHDSVPPCRGTASRELRADKRPPRRTRRAQVDRRGSGTHPGPEPDHRWDCLGAWPGLHTALWWVRHRSEHRGVLIRPVLLCRSRSRPIPRDAV